MQIGAEQRQYIFVATNNPNRPGYYIHKEGILQRVTDNYTKVSVPVHISAQELSDLLERPRRGFSKQLLVKRCESIFRKRSKSPAAESKRPILVDREQAGYSLGKAVQDMGLH